MKYLRKTNKNIFYLFLCFISFSGFFYTHEKRYFNNYGNIMHFVFCCTRGGVVIIIEISLRSPIVKTQKDISMCILKYLPFYDREIFQYKLLKYLFLLIFHVYFFHTDAFAEFTENGNVADSAIFRDFEYPPTTPTKNRPFYRDFAVSLSVEALIRVLRPKVGAIHMNIPTLERKAAGDNL